MPEKPETKTAGVPSGVIDNREAELRGEAAVLTLVDSIVRKKEDEMWGRVADLLARHSIPDRSNVPDIQNDRGERVLRVASPTAPLYRHLSESEREWRNPDSDHWMAEWVRGQFVGDVSRMRVAEAKLEAMFGRADTLEGAAGAAGAISDGTGGAIIPRPLEAVVLISRDQASKMRQFAQFYPMTAQQHTIPTAGAMTAAMVAEGTTADQGEPTIASVALVAHKAQAVAVASNEMLADAAINLITIYATRGGGALAKLENDEFFRLGSGTAPHVSKISGTTFNETSSGTLDYSSVQRMFYALPEEYLDDSLWFVASNVLQLLAGVRDGMGRAFYQGLAERPLALGSSIADGRSISSVGEIMGRPAYRAPFSSGDIWFGNPRAAYAIGQRQGITVESSAHVHFLKDKVAWKITERIAGVPVDTAAAQYCTGITAATSL